jgi:regulator of cell morphogenesis and NO signaling
MIGEILIPAQEIPELNVTTIQPQFRHSTIFQHFDELSPGEAFRILNDHDPKPLYYQMIGERGNVFTWTYLEKGPVWWRVEIRKTLPGQEETVGEIVANDIGKAEVFKKYGIDFCCGGKKPLQQVCDEKGIDISVIKAELSNIADKTAPRLSFNDWDADFLADYIFNQHHKYYYAEEPAITGLMEKVADHHGEEHPELSRLGELYMQLRAELNTHFMKEERVLFPFIKMIAGAARTNDLSILSRQVSVTEPIQIMESDHEAAGDILEEMQQVTGNYTPPPGACNSYKFLFRKLRELDEDLRQHIHLENNILFPKALSLEKQLRNQSM